MSTFQSQTLSGQTMGFFDPGYFDSSPTRKLITPRTIKNRLVASELGSEYYDGDRANGYGGFHDTGRWMTVWPKIIERYGLSNESRVLEVGCKKGFALSDYNKLIPSGKILGVESHRYPIECASPKTRWSIIQADYFDLPFGDDTFDFVLGFSSIYMLTLRDVCRGLREINRVLTNKSSALITVGAYESARDRQLFNDWTLIGSTVLSTEEWLEVFRYCDYQGDYFFTTPAVLGLEA